MNNRQKLKLAEKGVGFGAKPQLDGVGSSGTSIVSGVIGEEFLLDLQGQKAAIQYDRMRRRETQVAMILDAVKNPIIGANWSFEVEDETDAKQMDMKALVEWNFRQGLMNGLKQHIKECLTFLEFGFSAFEVIHATEQVPALGKLATYYKAFGFRKQITITKWNLEKGTGKLLSVEQQAAGSDVAKNDSVVIPGDYLLVFTNKKEGDNYEGISMLRPMYGAYSRKDLYLKLVAIGAEKYAIGVVKGTTPAGKSNGDEDAAFEAVLQAYVNNEVSYIKVPAGWSVEVQKIDFDPSKMVPMLNFENEEMARSVVASFLMLGQGGNGGAYSLGTDLSDFFLGGIQSYADIICEHHNRYSIPAICEMNFGPQASYPKLKCTGINDKAGKELADILSLLINGRAITPDAKLEDFLRASYDLPEVEPETARLLAQAAGVPQPTTTENGAVVDATSTPEDAAGAGTALDDAAPASGGGDNAPVTGDVRKETLNGAQVTAAVAIIEAVAAGTLPRDAALNTLMVAFNLDAETAERMLGSAGNGFVPAKPDVPEAPPEDPDDDPPTPPAGGKPQLSEARKKERVQFAESYKKQFDSAKAGTKALMQAGVRAMGDDLKRKLAKNWDALPESRKADATKDVEVASSIMRAYRGRLRDHMAGVASKAIKEARKELPSAAKKVEFAEYDPWENLNPVVKRAITAQLALIVESQAADIQKVVLFQWASSSSSMTSVEGILNDVESRIAAIVDGATNGMSIEASAGNAVAHVTQNSRNALFFDPEVLATLESFTFVNEDPVSEVCQNLNGQTFAANDPAAEPFYPPLHHNCKSRLVPNEKGSGEKITGIGVTADSVEERQRIENQITLHECCK